MFNWRGLRASAKPHALPRRRHYVLTRLGFHFVFVAGFAMVGGALRGFNLLLVLAGVLVGAVLMQWRYARAMLFSVSAERRLPPEAIAGVPFRVRYRIKNRARMMPAWMLRIEDQIVSDISKHPKRHRGLRVSDVTASCAVGYVSPKSSNVTDVDCVFSRRGRFQFGPLTVSTTFPFCLMTSRSVSVQRESLVVFPRLLQLRRGWHGNLLSRRDGASSGSQRSGAADGEFFGLRDWQSGDNPRWIHWRTSARIDELAVRQFEQHRRFDVCIVIDAFGPNFDVRGFPDSPDHDSDVELAISLAATLIVQLGAQPSNRVSLATAESAVTASDRQSSTGSQRSMLGLLSELQPSEAPSLCAAVKQLGASIGHTSDLVVISSRSFEEASETQRQPNGQPGDECLDHLVAPWVARGSFRWLDVRQPQVKQWIDSEQAAGSKHAEATA